MKFTLHIGWKDVATVREPTRVGRDLKTVANGDTFRVVRVTADEIEFVKEGQ